MSTERKTNPNGKDQGKEHSVSRPAEGMVPKTGDVVSGPGGPTFTFGGVMPGGPEMEEWKRPLKDSLNYDVDDELSVEEQAENVRSRAKK